MIIKKLGGKQTKDQKANAVLSLSPEIGHVVPSRLHHRLISARTVQHDKAEAGQHDHDRQKIVVEIVPLQSRSLAHKSPFPRRLNRTKRARPMICPIVPLITSSRSHNSLPFFPFTNPCRSFSSFISFINSVVYHTRIHFSSKTEIICMDLKRIGMLQQSILRFRECATGC